MGYFPLYTHPPSGGLTSILNSLSYQLNNLRLFANPFECLI